MENLFVPFDLAVKMKELGFNEPSLTVYKTDKRIMFSDDWACGIDNKYLTRDFMACLAPTYQQCVDWLRINHRIEVSSPCKKDKDLGAFYGGYVKKYDDDFGKSYGSNFRDYYEAYNHGIEEALKLI